MPPHEIEPDRDATMNSAGQGRPFGNLQGHRLVVWHDGACPLCRREIALMRRLDRHGAIDFIDIVTADHAQCPVSRADLLARFHALEDGQLLSGAAAFAAMWRAIPLLRPLGLLARNRRVLRALEWLYLRFLNLRPRLQRLVR
jgi:predicted DCC family thiol-disulfide oxidoreductase YuxK